MRQRHSGTILPRGPSPAKAGVQKKSGLDAGFHRGGTVGRPGCYLFRDYPRVGAPLSVIVILITAYVLSRTYGA